MSKNLKKRLIACIMLILVFLTFVPNTTNAEINELYGDPNAEEDIDTIPSSILLEWIASIAYNMGNIVEGIGATMMGWFTGVPEFPYSDKIVFNTVPILDINFINPASGSLFKDASGVNTKVGEVVRNAYFTCLSIALGFLGLIVAITAIRLAFSTIASEKAKYKQVIANTLITLILLFGLHYVLSFMFFLNEKMVEVASTVLIDALTGDQSEEVAKALDDSLMKDDKKLIENFFDKMGPNWLSPLTWVKEVLKGLANIGQEIYNMLCSAVDWIKDTWNSFWGGGEEEADSVTLDPSNPDDLESIEKLYPSRTEFQEEILNDETATHIAAFLLRDEIFRDVYLKWAEGSDMDSFDKNGVSGVAVGIASMVNDFLNIVDSGYLGIRSLHASTFFIKNGNYNALTSVNAVTDEQYALSNYITSTAAYNKFLVDTDKTIANLEKERDGLDWIDSRKGDLDQAIKINKTMKVYAKAYYKFIYDGDDKVVKGTSDIISGLGQYFKQNAKYVDLEKGDWAPTTTSIPFGILYAVFIVQSLMFLISYIKRLFYVVILSMLGPVVVIFDYLIKAI